MDVKQSPWLIACLLTWAACDPSQTTGPSTVFDLRMSSSTDMASTDLAMMTYKATLPTCSPVTITASQLFMNVVNGSCSCHKSTASPKMASAADLANLVNKMPRQAMLPLITSNDVNRSYVLFRLTGEGDQIPGGSAGYMPVGGSKLGTSPMCQWINWIKSGTPP
jgi:hypothetical protein